MRRMLALLALAVAAVASTAAPAGAITGNYVEDFEHPFVGLVVSTTPTASSCTAAQARCSRRRLSDRRPLHRGATTAPASTSSRTPAPTTIRRPRSTRSGLPGDLCRRHARAPLRHLRRALQLRLRRLRGLPQHPGRRPGHPRPGDRDSGVRPARRRRHARPAWPPARPQRADLHRERLRAHKEQPGQCDVLPRAADGPARLTNLRSALTDGFNLQTNGNGNGRGGTCSGDSGGPVFYGGFSAT